VWIQFLKGDITTDQIKIKLQTSKQSEHRVQSGSCNSIMRNGVIVMIGFQWFQQHVQSKLDSS
jgi:hypothetical protein